MKSCGLIFVPKHPGRLMICDIRWPHVIHRDKATNARFIRTPGGVFVKGD